MYYKNKTLPNFYYYQKGKFKCLFRFDFLNQSYVVIDQRSYNIEDIALPMNRIAMLKYKDEFDKIRLPVITKNLLFRYGVVFGVQYCLPLLLCSYFGFKWPYDRVRIIA